MGLALNDFSSDHHGWSELLPERRARSPLFGDHHLPWVVIGAGVTGLAAAHRLAELNPDHEIGLVDAREIGQGASGRNSGFAVAVSHFTGGFEMARMNEYARVNRINGAGLGILRDRVNEFGVDCQWRERGIHHTAVDQLAKAECLNFLHYLTELGIPHRELHKDELLDRLGTGLYQNGVHVGQGALLQPAALVRGLVDNLPANVSLYERSPVHRIDSGQPHVLNLTAGSIHAEKIILATNYEAPGLGFLRRRIIGSTLSGSFTRVLTAQELGSLGSLEDWGVLSLHGGGATVRLTTDGRICLRNAAEYHGGKLLSDRKLTDRQVIHRAGFDKRFPQLAHVPFEYAWSGVEGISRNGTNFFGSQGNNIYLAGGYNGSGLSRGTAFGTALAEYACKGQSQLITDCLDSAPGTWIPPRPILDIGAYFTVRSRFRGVGLDR